MLNLKINVNSKKNLVFRFGFFLIKFWKKFTEFVRYLCQKMILEPTICCIKEWNSTTVLRGHRYQRESLQWCFFSNLSDSTESTESVSIYENSTDIDYRKWSLHLSVSEDNKNSVFHFFTKLSPKFAIIYCQCIGIFHLSKYHLDFDIFYTNFTNLIGRI